jgi:hypothetical protein
LRFLERSMAIAEVTGVLFILPASFGKESRQDHVPHTFTLSYEETLPRNAFLANGALFDAPSCVQLWVRAPRPPRPAAEGATGFTFIPAARAMTGMMEYHVIVVRVGGNAGRAYSKDEGPVRKYNYFISLERPERTADFIAAVNRQRDEILLVADRVVGPRSVSKKELTPILNRCV